jgi:hypothetical protein
MEKPKQTEKRVPVVFRAPMGRTRVIPTVVVKMKVRMLNHPKWDCYIPRILFLN